MADYTVLEQVKIRLSQYHIENKDDGTNIVVFDNTDKDPLLEQLIYQATDDVTNRRMYPTTYTDDQIEQDLEKFQNVIINLTVYDYSQAGEAYMQSYSENGISRSWKDREELFKDVYPFAKIL